MDAKTAVATYFRNYVEFHGRSRRAEFWWGYLAFGVAIFVVAVVAGVVGNLGLLYLGYLVALPALLSSGARRLHDTGRSAWFLLLLPVPFGGIALLVFWVMDSEPFDNKYGPSPKPAPAYGYAPPPTPSY